MTRGAPRLPPPDLAERQLPTTRAGGVYYRCAPSSQPPLHWQARGDTRFSDAFHPTLYLADSKLTGFWECFGDGLNDQAQDQKALPLHLLSVRRWVRFTIDPPLRVLDVTDPEALRAIGADGGTFLADYSITRRWSQALASHSAQIDGLRYRSRLDSKHFCIAVWGRPALVRAAKRFRAIGESALLKDTEFLLFLAERDIALL